MRSLWIMRHGNAEWDAPSDRERQLSQSGTEQVASVAKKLDLEFPLEDSHPKRDVHTTKENHSIEMLS